MTTEKIIKEHTQLMLNSIDTFDKNATESINNWIHNLKVLLQYQEYILENGYIGFDKYVEIKADEKREAKEDARIEQTEND